MRDQTLSLNFSVKWAVNLVGNSPLCIHKFVNWSICLNLFSLAVWATPRICLHFLFCLTTRTLTDWLCSGHDPLLVLPEKPIYESLYRCRLESHPQRLWSTSRKFDRTITSGSHSGMKEETRYDQSINGLLFPEVPSPSRGSSWGQRMWTQGEMVRSVFTYFGIFRQIVPPVQLVCLSTDCLQAWRCTKMSNNATS